MTGKLSTSRLKNFNLRSLLFIRLAVGEGLTKQSCGQSFEYSAIENYYADWKLPCYSENPPPKKNALIFSRMFLQVPKEVDSWVAKFWCIGPKVSNFEIFVKIFFIDIFRPSSMDPYITHGQPCKGSTAIVICIVKFSIVHDY